MTRDIPNRVQAPTLELRVGFVLAPEFTLIALTGFIEALRIAGDDLDQSRNLYCRWDIMAPDSRMIRSSGGLSVMPTSRFQPPETFDYIVVVGGKLDAHDRIDPAIIDYLKSAAAAGLPLVGACTGSFLLARAGLMEGRRACIHQFHVTEFQSEFPGIAVESDHLFTIDGPRITCPGGASAMDLAIHLIQRHCGRERALKTVQLLLFDQARSSNHPQGRAAIDLSTPVRDPLVRRALLIMQQTIGDAVSIEEIAAGLGTNVRKLGRAFQAQLNMSPAQTYRQIRLARALWLMEYTTRSLSEISYECGFADASHFSRACRDAFQASPSDIRSDLLSRAATPAPRPLMSHLMPD